MSRSSVVRGLTMAGATLAAGASWAGGGGDPHRQAREAIVPPPAAVAVAEPAATVETGDAHDRLRRLIREPAQVPPRLAQGGIVVQGAVGRSDGDAQREIRRAILGRD